MQSLKFPKMFRINGTEAWKSSEYHDATRQNALLMLNTERGSLIGDASFGNTLKEYLFDQNNYILQDIVIDIIYSQLVTFLPQIKIERKDVKIVQDAPRGKIICTFTGISQIDFTVDTYSLELLTSSDF